MKNGGPGVLAVVVLGLVMLTATYAVYQRHRLLARAIERTSQANE